ncbi:MAG: acetylesterase [Oscillospiraceae bacterium]|jgi:S-formylglutathione hydrolase FrmB|nr:acetylesterase [Oscillospiraceae bacterium]
MAWLQINFRSNALLGNTTLNVLLPAETMPGFPPRPVNEWKTVYLLHGLMGDSTDWLFNGNLPELAQSYDTAFVLPSVGNSFYLDQEKSGAKYSTFLGQELVDFTRLVLPLSRKREDTVIAGLSMGGYGAIYNGLRWHETFGHIIGLSSANAYNEAPATDAELNALGLNRAYYRETFGDLDHVHTSESNPAVLAERVLSEAKQPFDLYFACGWNDKLVHRNRALRDGLDAIKFPYAYEEGPGTHEWAFWNTYLKKGLDRIWPAPKFDPEMMKQFMPFWIEKPEE